MPPRPEERLVLERETNAEHMLRERPPAVRPCVLIVDDDALIRLAATAHLEDCGYRICEAGDAQEAIARLNDVSGPPIKLVFSDINMPGPLDGLDLCRWIRLHRPALPVLLTSGSGAVLAAAAALCDHAAILPKPYDFNDLTRRIASALTRAQAAAR